MNRRIADPSNIPLTTNASLHGAEAAAAVASFEALWNEAAQVRQSRNATAEARQKAFGGLRGAAFLIIVSVSFVF